MLLIELRELLAFGGQCLLILLQVPILVLHHLGMLLEPLLEHLILFLKCGICLSAHTQLVLHGCLFLLELLFLGDQLSLSLLQALFQLDRVELLGLGDGRVVGSLGLQFLQWVLDVVLQVLH